MRHGACLAIVLVILLPAGGAKEIKRDPSTGSIRLLYIGAPFQAEGPYMYLVSDPLLAVTPISGNMFGLAPGLVKKAMRLYMPRTRADLVSKYDVLGIDDSTYTSYPANSLEWFREGCLEDGLGIFMGGGSEAFGGAHGFPSWFDTALVDVMPVNPLPVYGGGISRNVIIVPEDEFAAHTNWDEYEEHNLFAAFNVVAARPGANQISEIRPLGGGRYPGWTWWDIGRGRFFASPTGFRGSIGAPNVITSASLSFLDWKHYGDFVANMVYFTAGLTPPDDLQLLYTVRERFRQIGIQRQITGGMIEFAAKFNADTAKVDEKLDESEARLREARGHFVDFELEASMEGTAEVLRALEEAYDLALKARRSALLWVFVTEWLVVTATSLICGIGVWTLMVRRRLYREVASTRMARVVER
jgi:uncharacterized membrane protein